MISLYIIYINQEVERVIIYNGYQLKAFFTHQHIVALDIEKSR